MFYYENSKALIKPPKVSKKPLLSWMDNESETDDDFWDSWGLFIDDLNKILEQKKLGPYYRVKVVNFGWRSTHGIAEIEANNARDLLHKILPKTDCQFRIYAYRKGLAIQNYHHDSPTGNEWYIVSPIKESTFNS